MLSLHRLSSPTAYFPLSTNLLACFSNTFLMLTFTGLFNYKLLHFLGYRAVDVRAENARAADTMAAKRE